MVAWVRDPNSKFLNRVETDLNSSESEPEIEYKKMGEARPITLNDIFYPPRTTAQSCFNISALENVTLELKP